VDSDGYCSPLQDGVHLFGTGRGEEGKRGRRERGEAKKETTENTEHPESGKGRFGLRP
jgi:hypothetical protein